MLTREYLQVGHSLLKDQTALDTNMSSAGFPGGRTLSPLCVQLEALSLLLVCRENPISTSCLTSLSNDPPLSKCSILLKCWQF